MSLASLSKYFGIIGAGPSGLALSLFLKKKSEILEANNYVGGHAASFQDHGFTFDYGPHILFSKDQQILDFIISALGSNVNQCRRNNKISFKDRLINYPFENNLKSLSLEDNYECIRHFVYNIYKEKHSNPKNMREWFLKTFGEGICSRYLFPYNEKIWNIPVEQLSMRLAERIPNPPPEDILKSSLGYHTDGYLHQLYYHYPKCGGYQAICESLKKTADVTHQFTVSKIQFTDNKKIKVLDAKGNSREFTCLISTMPVHEMVAVLDIQVPHAIVTAINNLIVNPMFIVSFGICGTDPNQYTAIYFPESEFWVNRISYPCTFSTKNGPLGHWSLQAEITCKRNSLLWEKSDAEILTHTKRGLQKRQLLPSDEKIVFERIDRKLYSYVVYDTAYEQNATKVREWFASIGIYLLGRFSYFEYINVDMAINSALKLAIKLNEDEGNFIDLKSYYIKNALLKLTNAGRLLCV